MRQGVDPERASRTPDVLAAARAVLDRNWTGRHTVPATGLYPHQWSWDSAFIAVGTRHLEPERARTELRSLLSAQWADGRLPQIVYDVERDDDYAPGHAFWRSDLLDAGGPVPSAGLVQPPNHAWALWLVHRADPDREYLQWAYPRLVRWHAYLRERRRSATTGLPVVKHPWESGTDNSPLWDTALSRVSPDARTAVRRPDLQHAGPGERPGGRDYQRYYRLAEDYRDSGCDDTAPSAFAMVCPLTAALLAVSELALARIATEIGADQAPHVDAATGVVAAMDAHLWDEELGLYVAVDDVTGEQVRRATANGLVPLVLGATSPGLAAGRAERLLATLESRSFLGGARYLPSTATDDAAFDPALYWRGPAWFNVTWMLLRAARGLGHDDLAARLLAQFTDSAAPDFPEYVDPCTGAARGTRRFSWTAALTVDALTDAGDVF